MSTPLLPTAELVAVRWLLAAVTGLTGKVATTLPDAPWTDNEFVQVMAVGGSPDPDVPMFHPVVTVNVYAEKPGSRKPPWGQAFQLAQRIVMATYTKRWAPDPAVELTGLPANYGRAIVGSVFPVSEIRKLPSDPSQYAVYTMDLQFNWAPASVVIA